MQKKIISIILLVFSIQFVYAQKSKLAADYYRNGEYEKAAQVYKSLYKESKYSDVYFKYYYKSLLNNENFDEALKAINLQLKKKPNQYYLLVLKGNIFEQTGNPDKAEKYYMKAIKKAKPENFQIIKLANTFKEFMKYDLALKAYNKGLKNPKRKNEFLYYIGDLYGMMGDNSNMVKYYIHYIESKPNINSLASIKSKLARNLNNKELDSLKTKLIKSIQKHPDNLNLIDLLSWTYLKMGKYKKALRQVIAIDRRFEENGQRVYKFAIDARNAGKYSVAAKAFEYLTENKKQNSPYYFSSVRNYLNITKDLITSDTLSTKKDLLQIKNKYQQFINHYGINDLTFPLVLELANIEAYHLSNVDTAIVIINDLLKRRNIDLSNIARAKIALGDFLILKNKIWDASLLYSQVDKDFKEGQLGEIARFKNGKLYYYTGDYEWAQTIFNILKPATSRLISNDAIESSVFISESIGEDSTMIEPLKMYSKAELLILQNKFDKAISLLDSINFLYPKNNLEDDIWYLKANIFKKQKKYNLAIKMYNQILNKYPEELKADNSLYELANIYEEIFHDTEKAKQLYEKLFLDYENSTLAVEARKKYRQLNGENIQ